MARSPNFNLSFVHAGASTGPVLVLFHGTPGSAAELLWWDDAARRHGVQLCCMQRAQIAASVSDEEYFATLAAALPSEGALHFAGFSLGGFVALRTAYAAQSAGHPLASLHLLSAAAPLEAGDFLPHMAGQAVFRMARNSPRVLRLVATMQGTLAHYVPAMLPWLLFASARSSDKALYADVRFQSVIRTVLSESLCSGRTGYLRDLKAYVKPWAEIVPEIQAPTWLWHGRDDNWSPPGMAYWLRDNLPECRGLEMGPDQSHYGCLLSRIETVCATVVTHSTPNQLVD